MNLKDNSPNNCYAHVYFKRKMGVQHSLDGMKKKPHPRWKGAQYLLKFEDMGQKPPEFIRKIQAPPVGKSGDSLNQNKLEYPDKNSRNGQNQKVTKKSENKNNNANFANSEIRSQKNDSDNFYYRGHPMSQPHNFYQVSLPRDPNMTQSHYYGKHGFEQQILPDQSLMHEQLVSDQDYYQQYADPSYFGQKRYHRNYYDVQNYADSNSQFYDQGTMESYLNPNYEHQFSNENNPDMLYWCYPEYYSCPSY